MTTKFLNGIDLANQRLQNMADASAATDAVTLQQMQALVRGLDWKASVRVASTANVTLATPGATINGVTMAAGNRMLLKNQTTASENGIYVWNGASVAATRANDATAGLLTAGTSVYVEEGTVKADSQWVLTTDDPITVGTTSLTFTEFGGGGTTYTAGNGLSLTGSAFAVVAGAGIIADGASTRIDPSVVVRKFAQNIGDGSATTITVTHNLGTLDVEVQVVLVSTGETVHPDVLRTGTNAVNVTFAAAPTSNQYRVLVQG